MKVLYAKCENGHFFDANSIEKCPKCSSSVYTLLGESSIRRAIRKLRKVGRRRKKLSLRSMKKG